MNLKKIKIGTKINNVFEKVGRGRYVFQGRIIESKDKKQIASMKRFINHYYQFVESENK